MSSLAARIADALRMHVHPHLSRPIIEEALRKERAGIVCAVQQAVKEMEVRPYDKTEDIWNEAFDGWEQPYWMDDQFNIHDSPAPEAR